MVLEFAFTFFGFASNIAAQSNPPIRDLTTTESASPERFGNIFGARELTAGHVLVNDGIRRQLIELDASLTRVRIVLDSVAIGGNGYGPTASPLINYLGDSTLFVDGTAQALLVIDPNGKVSRVMAGPTKRDLGYLAGGPSGVDDKGRLIYRVISMNAPPITPPTPGKVTTQVQQLPDSAVIVRLDLDTRKTDTIARIKQQNSARAVMTIGTDGKRSFSYIVNPLETMDEWTVLSSGTLALVRGHDYHVDWLHSDGTMSASDKLPFDWKKVDDAEKQRLSDALRNELDSVRADAEQYGDQEVMRSMRELFARHSGGMALFLPNVPRTVTVPLAVRPPSQLPPLNINVAPLNEIADYYPPVHGGSALPDLDGNLWILPSTSKHSKAGELVYDVVNDRGVLTQRVRVPAGRSVAGFGKHGVVYLMSIDGKHGWKLERAKIGT